MSVEKSDVSAARILQIGAGLVVVVAIAFAAIHFWLRKPAPAENVSQTVLVEIPQPRLQTSQASDLRAMRAASDKTLQTYGWVDRDAGVARVPIQRAMELTLQSTH